MSRSHLIRKAMENHLADAESFANMVEDPMLRELVAIMARAAGPERQEVIESVLNHVREGEKSKRIARGGKELFA